MPKTYTFQTRTLAEKSDESTLSLSDRLALRQMEFSALDDVGYNTFITARNSVNWATKRLRDAIGKLREFEQAFESAQSTNVRPERLTVLFARVERQIVKIGKSAVSGKIPQFGPGTMAYMDDYEAGFVPCKVVSVQDHVPTVEITAPRKGFPKGSQHTPKIATRVIPRDVVTGVRSAEPAVGRFMWIAS